MTAPTAPEVGRLAEILKQHFLFDLGCSHEGAGSNRAACFCGWSGDRVENVGAAVAQWGDHVARIISVTNG